MLWIGLTGGIATGKSTVSRLLRARGFAVVDADQLARDVVQNGTQGHREVVQAFGPDAVAATGELNRKRIGEIVFQDRSKLVLLESIIHPRVRELALEKRAALEAEGRTVAFYDVPLLFEKKMQSLFDKVVVVVCSPEEQLARLMSRDGLSEDEAMKRIAAQLPIDEKAKLSDEVIRNEAGLNELEREVDAFLARAIHQAQT